MKLLEFAERILDSLPIAMTQNVAKRRKQTGIT